MKLHLPKKLLAAVMALFAVGVNTTMGSDTISINFGSGDYAVTAEATGELWGAGGDDWNNFTIKTIANSNLTGAGDDDNRKTYDQAFTIEKTDTGAYSPIRDSWSESNKNSVAGKMQYRYIDLNPNGPEGHWKVKLDLDTAVNEADAAHTRVDLRLYFSSDGGKNQISSVNVGGTSYIGGGIANNSVTSAQGWGEKGNAASETVGSHNTIWLANWEIADLNELTITNDWIDATKRGTISGIQVKLIDVYDANLTAGTNVAENITWSGVGGFNGAYTAIETVAERYLRADVSAGNATLEFANGAKLATLHAKGGNTLTVTTDGSISIGDFYTESGSTISLGANILKNNDTLTLGGEGTVELTESVNLTNVLGYGKLHIAKGVKINLTAFDFAGVATGDEGAELNIDLSKNSSITINGITVTNNGGTVSGNALSEGKAEFSCSDGASIGVSSIGGTLLVTGEEGTKVTLDSLVLNGPSTTTISADEGVTLSGTAQRFQIDTAGQELVVGTGVSLIYTGVGDVNLNPAPAENYALAIGNGKLTIDGGRIDTVSLIAGDFEYGNKKSTINIDNNGLLNIYGEVNSINNGWANYGKNGSARLNHWSGSNVEFNISNGGEFRVLGATVNVGDNGTKTVINTKNGGILNVKGFVRATNDTIFQLNADTGSYVNIGEEGIQITNDKEVSVSVSGTIGALSEKGWSSTKAITLNDGATVQLAVWDVENKQYTDTAADISFGGEVLGSGILTLAGSGKLIVSSGLAHDVSSTGGQLALTGLDNFKFVGTGDTFTGYGDSTTDGYAAAMYRIAGAGSTITEAILIKGEGNELTCTVDAGVMTVDGGTVFVVNTEVDRAKITEWKEGSSLVLGANSVYRTSEISDLGVIDKVVDDTAVVYVQNTEGKDLLKITNVPTAALNISIGGEGNNEILCSDSTYTGNFTVLSGATLKQSGNDTAGEGVDTAPDRIITIAKGGTFDINGSEAYYNIVMEGGAVLTNTGEMLKKVDNTNAPAVRNIASVTLTGDATVSVPTETLESNGATVNLQKSFGIVGGGWGATTLNLNNNVLTKTGGSNFYLNNCTISAGTIRVEEGEIELMEFYGPQKTDASAATFELAAATGGLSYETGSTDIVVGHIIASGGYVRTIGDRSITVNKITGSEVLSKIGSGNMSLADGIEITEDVNIKVDAGTLTLSTVNIATGKTLNITGTATADVLTKKGAGRLTLDALTANVVNMSSGLSIDSITGGAQIIYTDIASIGSITVLGGDTIIDLFGVANSVADGINLGIAYSNENVAKVKLVALEDMVDADGNATWELVNDNGFIKLQGKDGAKITVHTDWDPNWGGTVLHGGPKEVKLATLTTSTSLMDNNEYKVGDQIAVQLTGSGNASAIITGGACHTTRKKEGDPVALNNDVWIDAAVGTYKAIVGGHWTDCWANATPYSVDSNVHIVLKGATVEHIIGGSVRETVNPIHEGDSYISIFNGDVTGNIVGASTVGYHGDGADTKAEFNGTTNIFVYTLLNNNTATNIFSESSDEVDDVIGAIVGGGMVHGHKQKANLSVNKIANVTIDLSNVTTSTTSTFSKMIVGGNLNCNNDDVADGTNTYIYGTNVTIKGNGVAFTNKVIGASYVNMGNNTVGDVSLDISGGTYSNIVTGGVYAYSKANCTISDVEMSLSDAACTEWVAGGAFLNSSSTTLNLGAVKLTLTDASFDKLAVGGVFVGGHSSNITGGNIDITIDGAEFKDKFYGSVYHFNTQYGSTSRVGDVRISLVGDGVVSGAIYAAGGAAGSAANIYVNSTTISIKDTVQLKDGSIISAGFNVPEGDYRNVSVTGDRTILFTGEKSQDRKGILFSDFNKIGVETAGTTATIGGADITITDALTVIGEGTLKLAANTGLNATQGITVEAGATVALNGNAATGDVLVNGGVNVVGGGSLNGDLTLAAGSTLTLWDGTDAGLNGVLDMSVPTVDGASLLAEGNVLTIGGLFGLDVKVNPDGEVELVTGLGGIEGITFDEENKALAGTYLSDINGEDVDGKLYLVYEEGTLKLSAIAGMTDFYWEDTDATGETWTEKLWSVKDNNGDNLVFIKDAATRTDEVNAFFNNGKAENVLVDTTATVDDLTVSGAGSDYTFSQATGTNGTLTIEGKLTVTDSATATFDGALADVGAAEMEVSKGATLVAGAVTITDGVTVDAGTLNVTSLGAASLDASNGASIDADNVVITGKVGVDSAGLDISDSLSAAEITITGDTASVKAGTITVGEGNLSMDGGTLAVDTLTGEGTAEITGGTLTIGSTDLSSVDVSSAEFVGSSTLAGSDAVDVTVGGVSVADGAELNLSDATLNGKITVEDGGTLKFGGTMHLDTSASDFGLENKSTYAATADASDLGEAITDGGNGFVSRNEIYTVVDGSLTNVNSQVSTWTVGADARVGEYANGKVTISESKDTSTYWVNGNVTLGNISENFVENTDTIKLNGGMLQMNEETDLAIVTNNENAYKTDSRIALWNGSTLKMEKLTITDGTTVTLSGSADSALELGDGYKVDSTKLKGLDSTDAWLGTVKTGAINGGLTPVDISGLGNANSSVEADSISGQSMTAGTVGTVDVLGDVSLTNGDSTVNDMTVEGNLSLGATADSSLTAGALTVNGETGIALQNGSTVDADTLTVTNGGIDLSEGSAVTADEALTVGAGITLGKDAQVKAGELKVGSLSLEEGSSVGADTLTVEGSIEYKSLAADAPITVGDMTNDTLDLTVDTELLKDAVDADQDVTFIHVANGSEAEISLNGGSNVLKNHGEKYSYTVDWDEAGQNVTLDAIANENYMKEKFEGAEPNAIAGATLMDEAFASDGIGAGGDLEKLLAAVDNGSMTEEGMAAVAGSSTASLGMAFAGDVERQLRAIRNRTTTMGVNQCVVNEGMPYFNAWVNAEGNFGELDQDGLASGYQLDSWGGTVGFDVDVNPNLTLGLAVTAMYGDLTVDGPDMLEGDLDTYYVTAFARYSKRAWTHTFIGTIGKMDGSYERTVNYAGGSYKTEGDTDGMAFGLMYEVGRVYALTEDGDACLQPVFNIAYRHTTVGGYTEDGGDAALDVDDQTLDTITLGAGARFQAVVGENLYNRTSVLELRALAKLDVGDRASEADVAFINGTGRGTVESAELGAFGVELGAGLSIPVGDENDGTIFFDVSAELRSGYSNVNGTVGYRINF